MLPLKPLSIAYIGLGSNLNNPCWQVRTALNHLAILANTELVCHSSFYETPPLGPANQPDYINAAAKISTALTPHQLLDALQEIEQHLGRVRIEHWGPRTIDLDILLFDNIIMQTQRLTIPHQGLTKRAFVLYPLAEIAPGLQLPDGNTLAGYLNDFSKPVIKETPYENTCT